MKKRVISLLTALCMLGLLIPSTVGLAETVFPANAIIEAEDGVFNNGAVAQSSATASGGEILLSAGSKNDTAADAAALANPDAAYTVNVEQAGIYKLWIKAYCPDQGSDSAWAAIDDVAYTASPMVVDTRYVWVVALQKELTVGQHVIKLVRRETTRIDQLILTNNDNLIPIDYDGATAIYVARSTPVSVYPDLLGQNVAPIAATAQPFVPGDRVAFIGDSITHGGSYHANVLNYYATRYPDSNFTYVNLGINGDTASGLVQKRLSDEILGQNFTKAVIMLGMNDMSRSLYFVSSNSTPGIETQRQSAITKYQTNMRTIVDSIQAKGWPITLIGPTCFDEWLATSNNENSPGFNNILRNANIFMKNLATEKGCAYIDFNTPQLIAKQYFSASNSTWTMAADRIHPDANGHYIMSLAMLKAQGESGEVASVNINAGTSTVNAANAVITNLSTGSRAVSYTYQPNSLPMAADSAYRNAEKLFPVTEELNREVIKVTGMDQGNYAIKMDGVDVATVTSKDLAKGVNIADLQNNPGQIKSLHIKGLVAGRSSVEKLYRDFRYNELTYIATASYGLNKTSAETLIASAQAYIDANQSNPDKAADVDKLKIYISNKQAEPQTKNVIATYEAKIYADNKPTAHAVSIAYAGAWDTSVSVDRSYSYADVELAADTVRIGTKEIFAIGDSASLSSISYKPGSFGVKAVLNFNPMVRVYNVELPLNTTTVDLSATKVDVNASIISGTGTIAIGQGTTTSVISVRSADSVNTKNYTVNFTVSDIGTSANLSSISYGLNGGTATALSGFNPSVTTYNVDVPLGTTTSIQVSAVAEDSEANVTGTGTLTVGTNPVTADITVVSSDLQTTKQYTVNFNPVVMGNITQLTVNPNSPKKKPITYGDKLGDSNYFYCDRTSIIAAHIPNALVGATMVKMPLDDTRSTDTTHKAFLSGDNEYFNFTADTKGVVYVISSYAVNTTTNFTSVKGWTTLNNGTGLTYPITYNGTAYSGFSALTLNAPKYHPERPLTYLSWIEYTPAGVYSSARECKYVVAKPFNANEQVSIPTMGVTASDNFVAVIKWGTNNFVKSNNAKLSALSYKIGSGGANPVTGFTASDAGGIYNVELPVGTTSVSLAGTASDTGATVAYDKATLATFPGNIVAIATAEDGTTKTYTVNFSVVDVSNVPGPGSVYNLKYRGADAVAPFAAVTGVSGTAPINISGDNTTYPTQADKIAAAINPLVNSYKNNSIRMYSDRTPYDGGGSGSSASSVIGSHMEFSYIVKGEEATSPEFVSPNVTRILTKNDEKGKTDLIPDAYTFTIDKPATVYIAWGFNTAPSANILNNGWTLDTTGLKVCRSSITNLQYTVGTNADSKYYAIPNGTYSSMTGIYSKHYNAGANVQIPSTGGLNTGLVVLIIWDTVTKQTITGVSLNTPSNMTQTYGTPKAVTFRATATPSVDVDRNTIEWYVNGVKQSNTGANYTYTPSDAGQYVVSVKISGNEGATVNTKTITVSKAVQNAPTLGVAKTSDTVTIAPVAGAEYGIKLKSSPDQVTYGTSNIFTGLTPNTVYTAYIRMAATGNYEQSSEVSVDVTTDSGILYGDINGDGEIDISDVIMAAEIAVGGDGYTAQQKIIANVSSKTDMTVDISDVVLIAERAVGGTTAFPVE